MKEINVKIKAKIVSRIEYGDFIKEVWENQQYYIIIIERKGKKKYSIIPK